MSSLFICLDGAKLQKSTKYSAGIDIYLPDDQVILPQRVNYIPLGFKLNIENQLDDVCYQLLPRSSSYKTRDYEIKQGLIDNDYPDEIKLIVVGGEKEVIIPKGTKIAQLLPVRYLNVVDDPNILHSQQTRIGGFGSTN